MSSVLAVLLYAAETWAMKKKDERRLLLSARGHEKVTS